MARGGKVPLKQVLRHRVRYLIDGGVFGSAAFVESVFLRYRRDLRNDLMEEPPRRNEQPG